MEKSYGKLYIVSTPIGNLLDMTFRAIDTLKNVDLIACEDTRRTMALLNHFEIKTKVTSCHKDNEYEKAGSIIEHIKNGFDVAMVTDAGTPIISDPGNILVKKAIDENIDVIGIPGACALINALVVSGLSAKNFVFVGFLSDNKKIRKETLTNLTNECKTMVFYISMHNLISNIDDLISAFGENRNASISREMTKIYEETIRGSLIDIKNYFKDKTIKGEFVLVVEGVDENIKNENAINKWDSMTIKEHNDYYIKNGLSEKEAMKKVAEDRNIDKREVYREIKIKV